MSLVEAIVERLTADADFAAALQGRIGTTGRFAALPGVTVRTVSDPRPQHFKGLQAVRQTMVQVDVYARTDAEAEQLGDAAIAILLPTAIAADIRFQRGQIGNVRRGAEQGRWPAAATAAARLAPEIALTSIDIIFTHRTI